MLAGSLRKKLSFQSLGGTPNSMGELTTWTTYYSCRGSVQILRAQLAYSTGDFIAQSTYDVRIRYTATQSFSVGDRFLTEDGTVFQIDVVMNVQMRNREIQILSHVINQAV
jgi:SPP1 family predicted phage head-tail adaptor